MPNRLTTIALGAAAVAAAFAAAAQPAAPDHAAQDAAGARLVPYRSAFEGYRRFSAGEPGDWRKANDTVRAIGGWRAYAREIQRPAQPASGAASAARGHEGMHR